MSSINTTLDKNYQDTYSALKDRYRFTDEDQRRQHFINSGATGQDLENLMNVWRKRRDQWMNGGQGWRNHMADTLGRQGVGDGYVAKPHPQITPGPIPPGQFRDKALIPPNGGQLFGDLPGPGFSGGFGGHASPPPWWRNGGQFRDLALIPPAGGQAPTPPSYTNPQRIPAPVQRPVQQLPVERDMYSVLRPQRM